MYFKILKRSAVRQAFFYYIHDEKMKHKLNCYIHKVYADQVTPIGVYLNIRGRFPGSILLESSEIDDQKNAHSIICAQPIAGIQLTSTCLTQYDNIQKTEKPTSDIFRIQEDLNRFFNSFEVQNDHGGINGFFGFQAFEAVRYFETKNANLCEQADAELPLIDYRLFQYVICFNHFNNEIIFIENASTENSSTIVQFASNALSSRSGTFPFKLTSTETAYTPDADFLENINIARTHCKRGDVFQMVLSRKFGQPFQGDEFNVYRALRHINPSPYMFFFDYSSFKIFGSSPETQIRIINREAMINPIAGTYKRTGNKEEDDQLGISLLNDHKESAEHCMLVDLARNDLNRHCSNVSVSAFRTVKQFSHVIHLVSNVKGELNTLSNSIEVLADTFPAGTLSGAPKIRAIQLLARIERDPRGYYGGSIGFIDFKGNVNQAIMIRSFLSKNNELIYRAGAGIVLNSKPDSELQEVDNKLAALRTALMLAQNF